MAMSKLDLYALIEEKVEEMKGDWKTLFLSDEYGQFLNRYAKNLVAGFYESLQAEGSVVPKSFIETELKRINVTREYDPAQQVPAYCVSTPKNFEVCINGANVLTAKVSTVEEKHASIVGFVVHEVGHRLCSDYPTQQAKIVQMKKMGMWYPFAPRNINTVDGVLLQQKIATNLDFRKTVSAALMHLDNYVEDGYVENEMRAHYPGMASTYLGETNKIMLANQPTLTDLVNKAEPSNMEMILSQYLVYAKFQQLLVGEKDEDDFDPKLMETIYAGLDIIDEAVNERDPRKRAALINELFIILAPFVEEEINNQQQQQQQQQNQQQGQQGQGNAGGGDADANQAVQDMLDALATAVNGGVSQSAGDKTSTSATDTSNATNMNLQDKVSPEGSGKERGATSGGEPDLSAATQDLENLLSEAALAEVKAENETSRAQDMQSEAEQIAKQNGISKPEIQRAATVSNENKEGYEKACGRALKIAKRLAQRILKEMTEYEDDDLLTRQYSGSKFNSKSYIRDKLRGFDKKGLPMPTPDLSVYVLVDESGSVSQTLTAAQIETCIVLEEFCRTCGIPLCIQGYTTGDRGAQILSYVEEEKIDNQDKYRLTGMTARYGTPTVDAMTYAMSRMEKSTHSGKKLLFVITDGGAGDDDRIGTKTKRLIERGERSKIRVVGCGIGPDKGSVLAEFGEEHFLEISDLEKMPEQLVDIVRRRMTGVKR